eukprot:Plantae.Rhodophyta-Hildenbrandia_rubra.ctg38070.p1 GENE.Plantae.Rhodophyta-Hildenbrandia_rubra.ctg38070~~Plantae.Rhodophyta-Hildenbrandia_rubra.ctg38070.p1  ORF type:complete len:218 (-),score=17.26 Plantae.Rhodophyta-Hildenbrandia_rubra.ctg38070:23-676(-)
MSIKLKDILQTLPEKKACIFDCDGTLLDSMPLHYTSWHHTLTHHNIPFTPHTFYTTAGLPSHTLINHILKLHNIPIPFPHTPKTYYESITSTKHHFHKTLPPAPLIKITKSILDFAIKHNIKCAVVSGNDTSEVVNGLRNVNILDNFEVVICKEDVVRGKPDPQGFLMAVEKLGVDKGDCVGFEDGDAGLEALESAGIDRWDVRRVVGYPLPEFYRN